MRSRRNQEVRAVSLRPTTTAKKRQGGGQSPVWERTGGDEGANGRRVLSQRQQRMMMRCLEEYARSSPSNPQQRELRDKLLQTMREKYSLSQRPSQPTSPSLRCVCRNQPELCALIHLRHWQEMIPHEIHQLTLALTRLQEEALLFEGALQEKEEQTQDPFTRLRELRRELHELETVLKGLDSEYYSEL